MVTSYNLLPNSNQPNGFCYPRGNNGAIGRAKMARKQYNVKIFSRI